MPLPMAPSLMPLVPLSAMPALSPLAPLRPDAGLMVRRSPFVLAAAFLQHHRDSQDHADRAHNPHAPRQMPMMLMMMMVRPLPPGLPTSAPVPPTCAFLTTSTAATRWQLGGNMNQMMMPMVRR